jgi:NAD/NADP transhydrogenase beta subunit
LENRRNRADTPFMLKRRSIIALSVVAGVALELGIHMLSGHRESWDSPLYWTLGLPVVAVLSAAIGLASERSDWLWTFLIVPSQVTTLMVRSGEIGNLWPLTAVLSSLLSVPFVAAAFVGSRFRRTRR